MRGNFKITTRRDGGSSMWITASGDFDLAGEQPFKEAVDEFMRQGLARLVVDLRRLTFLDATAIRMLVSANEAMGRHGREPMTVIPGPRRVMRPLEVTGIATRLRIRGHADSGAETRPEHRPTAVTTTSNLLDHQKAAFQRVQIGGSRWKVLPRN